jgi:hypothetical protein
MRCRSVTDLGEVLGGFAPVESGIHSPGLHPEEHPAPGGAPERYASGRTPVYAENATGDRF